MGLTDLPVVKMATSARLFQGLHRKHVPPCDGAFHVHMMLVSSQRTVDDFSYLLDK